MNLNDHPHPYGIMIAGNDLGTPQQSYLYCAAYGNGTFIVRGIRSRSVPGERPPRRTERRGAQGGRQGSARHAGDRGVGEG